MNLADHVKSVMHKIEEHSGLPGRTRPPPNVSLVKTALAARTPLDLWLAKLKKSARRLDQQPEQAT